MPRYIFNRLFFRDIVQFMILELWWYNLLQWTNLESSQKKLEKVLLDWMYWPVEMKKFWRGWQTMEPFCCDINTTINIPMIGAANNQSLSGRPFREWAFVFINYIFLFLPFHWLILLFPELPSNGLPTWKTSNKQPKKHSRTSKWSQKSVGITPSNIQLYFQFLFFF